MLISFKKSHKQVGTQTISSWLKLVMRQARIDNTFTAHSTRHPATSKASSKGLDINLIKKTAGWSINCIVFAKFYNRAIQTLDNDFVESVFSF